MSEATDRKEENAGPPATEHVDVRVFRETFGIRCVRKYMAGVDSPERIMRVAGEVAKGPGGELLIDSGFSVLTRAGDALPVGYEVEKEYRCQRAGQQQVDVSLLRTRKSQVLYCDEEGVSVLGQFSVSFREGAVGDRVRIRLRFGSTEVECFVVTTDDRLVRIPFRRVGVPESDRQPPQGDVAPPPQGDVAHQSVQLNAVDDGQYSGLATHNMEKVLPSNIGHTADRELLERCSKLKARSPNNDTMSSISDAEHRLSTFLKDHDFDNVMKVLIELPLSHSGIRSEGGVNYQVNQVVLELVHNLQGALKLVDKGPVNREAIRRLMRLCKSVEQARPLQPFVSVNISSAHVQACESLSRLLGIYSCAARKAANVCRFSRVAALLESVLLFSLPVEGGGDQSQLQRQLGLKVEAATRQIRARVVQALITTLKQGDALHARRSVRARLRRTLEFLSSHQFKYVTDLLELDEDALSQQLLTDIEASSELKPSQCDPKEVLQSYQREKQPSSSSAPADNKSSSNALVLLQAAARRRLQVISSDFPSETDAVFRLHTCFEKQVAPPWS